jgi:hypothetical protein
MHWIEQTITEGLALTDQKIRLQKTAQHLLDQSTGVWTAGRIRPSLIADPCPLSQVKKFLGHTAQPGFSWGATRNGRPNGGTALNFDRGFFAEAMIVTAIEDSGRCKIIGRSPGTVFTADPDYEAHPDVVIETDEKEIELIQIKCPSVFMFSRIANNRGASRGRYYDQLMTEMYVGRKMGIPIVRTNLVLFTLEAKVPGITQSDGLNMIVEVFDWTSNGDVLVEHKAEEIRANVAKAKAGNWPLAYPISKALDYPCSYCSYARAPEKGIVGCEENDKWTIEEGRQLAPAAEA